MLFSENKETHLYEQEKLDQKAVVVGVSGYNRMQNLEESMAELKELCFAVKKVLRNQVKFRK